MGPQLERLVGLASLVVLGALGARFVLKLLGLPVTSGPAALYALTGALVAPFRVLPDYTAGRIVFEWSTLAALMTYGFAGWASALLCCAGLARRRLG